MSQVLETRTYRREECAVFRKTNEAYGGLSNMAPGFPVRINGVLILTVEALYQACRFPHMPEVQRLILEQHSPMTAKMVSKPYRNDSRSDWDHVRVKIMRWCLRLKLLMHRSKFTDLLLSTGDRPIVEDSRKDDFWGALRKDSETLAGRNVLGRLLMELREEIKGGAEFRVLEPPAIPSFLLFGQSIGLLDFRTEKEIQRSPLVDKVRIPLKVSSRPLFPELFPESKSGKSSLANPQKSGPQEHNLLRGAQPYAEYKDSGLPWLGRIPSHWDVKRAKSIFQRVDIRSKTGKEELLTVSSARGIVPRKTANVTMFKAESYLGYKLCWPGDLVINSLWAWAGGLGVSKHHGIISSAYGVYRIREDAPMLPAFVHEVTRSSSFNWELKVRSKGVWISRLQLTDISFLDAPMHIPPVIEQHAIMRFLDWSNGRLDRAIRAKRKVIALLNEQKQVIIHHAVTRGLDPSVPLKPSGIPWLGDIPQHWEARRSKYIYREVDSRSETGEETHLSMSQKFGLIPYSQIEEKRLISESYAGAKLCEKGDLVLNRLKAHLGVFALAPERGLVSPDYTVLRPLQELEERYFEVVYRSPACRVELRKRTKGIVQGFWRLYTDDFYNIRVPFPPVDEQRQIIAQLDIDLSGINTAISRLEREIDLLREYRTRLVADVVTGKLDVRDAAAKLPVEEQEIEPGEELVDEASEVIEDELAEPVG